MKNSMLQGVSLQTVIEDKEAVHFLNPILPNLCKAVGVKRENCLLLACFFVVC